MPSPVKEWRCLAHGPFESRVKKCPHGCTTVEWSPRTPPLIGTHGAKNAQQDRLQAVLARQYGNGNLKTAQPGQSMNQAMNPSTGSRPNFEPPKSTEDVIALLQKGINPGTTFVPSGGKIGSNRGTPYVDEGGQKLAIPHHNPAVLEAAAKAAPQINPAQAALNRLRSSLIVNKPNENDARDLAKMVEG